MKSVTIPGKGFTEDKTFTVGRVYRTSVGGSHLDEKDVLMLITDIRDDRVYWRDIYRGATSSFGTKQLVYTSRRTIELDSAGKQKLIRLILDRYEFFPFDKS